MAYGSMDGPKNKWQPHLKEHKWHAQNIYVRLVKGLYGPYQALPNASMSNGTVNFAGEHH